VKEDRFQGADGQNIGLMNSLVEIHGALNNSERKRSSIKERMTRLGIEESDYQEYEEMFLRPRQKHNYLLKTSDSWVARKHPWSKNQVLRHLTGEQIIGLFPADCIDYLMIDIDRHRGESTTTMLSRINQVRELFDDDPLIYQSSYSCGIRLCYFLQNSTPQVKLHQGCKELFKQNNLTIQPGVIEILASKKGDRLPFGEGSYLLDSFDLEPIYHLTLKETISLAYEVFRYQKIELPFETQKEDELLVVTSQGTGVFNVMVNRLYEEGLYPGITTNDALLMLSWDLQIRKAYSKAETERILVSWVKTKHNGLSDRYNSGKIDQTITQITRIVSTTDIEKASFSGSRYALREKRLSLNDIRKIVSITQDPKLRLAIFSLLEYCLCFGKRTQDRKRDKEFISNLYVSERGYVTYRSGFTEDFYCEISKKTLQHLPGFDKANPQIIMKKILDLELLSLKRKAHPESHHCRQYWVHFKFDENDPTKVVSLDEGLLLLEHVRREISEPTVLSDSTTRRAFLK
jgi:hypothetical protein